jgi:hypothetical protein
MNLHPNPRSVDESRTARELEDALARLDVAAERDAELLTRPSGWPPLRLRWTR